MFPPCCRASVFCLLSGTFGQLGCLLIRHWFSELLVGFKTFLLSLTWFHPKVALPRHRNYNKHILTIQMLDILCSNRLQENKTMKS